MGKRKSVELPDVNRELQKAIGNGKAWIGSKGAIKKLRESGEGAKIVVHASNCPEEIKDEFKRIAERENENITIYEYPANSFELGLACGKPFSIASLCIIDHGESEISRLLSHNFHAKENKLLQGLQRGGRGKSPNMKQNPAVQQKRNAGD